MAMLNLSKRFLRAAAFAAVLILLLYALAGRRDLVRLNVLVGVLAVITLGATLRIDPELLQERLRGGQETTDPVRLALIRLSFLALLVVSVLDVGRFHWSDSVPAGVGFAALAVFAASLVWVYWAMSVNRFFLPVIRLQPERGHRVVDTGPYRVVRHPGYTGMVLAAPAGALALGSWWGVALAVGLSLLFVWRAADEDRFLLEHLEGYAAYREQVRFRLIPGAW